MNQESRHPSPEAGSPDERALIRRLRQLFETQSLAVLATCRDGVPHGSLVAFAATEDLRHVVFATTRATRKYAQISSNPTVALLIDDRSNAEADFHEAIAATVSGQAAEVAAGEKERLLALYLAKHPHLAEFVGSPTCALIKVAVNTYRVVSQFANVTELRVGS